MKWVEITSLSFSSYLMCSLTSALKGSFDKNINKCFDKSCTKNLCKINSNWKLNSKLE